MASGQSSDLGLNISYAKYLKKNGIALGMEIRSIDWGNHWGLILAYDREYFRKDAIKMGGLSGFHPGLALFQQKQLGSYGISQAFYVQWQSKKKSLLRLDIGLRYNVSPAYKVYGNYQQFEFPISLNWGLNFAALEKEIQP